MKTATPRTQRQTVKEDLERRLGVPVLIANDANCFALAETHLGAVRQHHPDAKVVFGIIMGTGSGPASSSTARSSTVTTASPGSGGTTSCCRRGAECYCGKRGCVEDLHQRPGAGGLVRARDQTPSRSPRLRRPRAHDHVARLTMDRLHLLFGQALANVVNILDPDVIVIGGGVGNVQSLYRAGRQPYCPSCSTPSSPPP